LRKILKDRRKCWI